MQMILCIIVFGYLGVKLLISALNTVTAFLQAYRGNDGQGHDKKLRDQSRPEMPKS